MAKQRVLIGTTDYTVLVKMRDDAGAPATGLAHTDIDIAYARVETDNDVTTSDAAPADLANLTAAHSDWGWEEVSATDHPGLYRLDIADAVFAAGAWSAVVTVTGTGLDPADMEFELVAVNDRDGVRAGLTALPNAAADAAGGLPVSDAGGLDLDTFLARLDAAISTRLAAASAPSNFSALGINASGHVSRVTLVDTLTTYTGNTPQTGDAYARIGANGASLSAIPWNAAWDAEVQSECDDAFEARGYTATVSGRIDAAVSSRLASASYTAPPSAASIRAEIDANSTKLDVATSTRASPAQVNTEMLDVLVTDTFAEPSAVPAATASLKDKIGWVTALARNKLTQTSGTATLLADNGSTTVATSTTSDDGTTFTRAEWA